MIVDFFRRGTGASSGPLDYLLGKHRDREHATVLQGDVQEVAGLIDSSPYIKKYTAGCLSFYEHDLRPEQKQQIMDDFEKCLFPGMTKDQYRILWVEHQDKINLDTGETRLELNFLIPNVEVNSGKRLQPFYAAADLDRVDCFKQITNHHYGLFDPDDPANRQATKVAKALPTNGKELKATLEIEAALAIGEGIISDRQSLVQWLTEIGLEVTRQTPKSVSVKHKDDAENARPIRLTGAMYEQDFRYTDESPELTTAASERYRAAATERYTASCERYDKMLAAKSEYHQQRYRQESQRDPQSPDRSNSSDIAADRAAHSKDQVAATAGHDRAIAATANTDQTATSELAAVERLEPRIGTGSKDQENPFHIEYSLDFNSLYHAYQQYLSGIRQQEQVQRHHRDGEQSPVAKKPRGEPKYSEVWDREKMGLVRPDRPESAAVQQQYANSAGNQLNESRSTVIADYRAATAAAQRATETARASLTAYSGTEQNHRRIRELQQQTSEALQAVERERKRAGQYHQETTESEAIRGFIARLGEQLKTAITEPFRAIGDWVKSKERDQRTIANDDLYRNREAVRADDQASSRENEFSRAISTKSSSFSAKPIREALIQLAQKQEQQQELERNKNRGFEM